MVVNEVSSKRRQIDGANLIEWRWMSVMDPAKPGPKPIDVIQVGGHRSRCQVAFNEMVPEGLVTMEKVRIVKYSPGHRQVKQ